MTYVPWKGVMEDGTEVLVTLQLDDAVPIVLSAEVAFRDMWDRTWGPPVQLERAP